MPIRSDYSDYADGAGESRALALPVTFPDRVFHLEILKGGMNRLLFRSNRSETWPSRLEVLFMNVQYLSVGTLLHDLTIETLGPLDESTGVAWQIDPFAIANVRLYAVRSTEGEGHIVAGSVSVDESDAGPGDPSGFYMMD